MKKLIIAVLALCAARAGYADEIILKDGTVLKGTVIQVTDSAVEYDPEGPAPFDTVSRERISKIIYPGGREQHFLLDSITLTGGATIRCSIVRVTKDSIVYRKDGVGEEITLGRDGVARIDFSDGRSVEIAGKEVPVAPDQPAQKPAGGYHSSIFRMSLFGGGGLIDGGTIHKERRVFRSYRTDLMVATMNIFDHDQYAGFGTGGVEMEFMPPAIRFSQERAFDFTGIKFGIRGRYGYEQVMSVITTDAIHDHYDGPDDIYTGRLMKYHYWTAGPVINFIFSPRSNVANFMLSLYGMAGQVFGGNLNPMSSLRQSKNLTAYLAGVWSSTGLQPLMGWANLYSLSSLNKTTVRGHTIRCGFGPEFSLNRHFPLVIGLHVTYAYTSLTYGRAPLIYMDGNKKAAHHELGGEVSVGIHM
ncbi:MAG TPA: hypothetical protein PLD91_02310 [Spirochaetota bacterium]|mgnify:CR=1 FL=1|nr:hypothetical protein [Spirochaetota bacterium]